MPIEPWEETRPVANRRDAGLYGSRDGTVVERGDAGSAIAARMGTGEAHGDALARAAPVVALRGGALLRLLNGPAADACRCRLPVAVARSPLAWLSSARRRRKWLAPCRDDPEPQACRVKFQRVWGGSNSSEPSLEY